MMNTETQMSCCVYCEKYTGFSPVTYPKIDQSIPGIRSIICRRHVGKQFFQFQQPPQWLMKLVSESVKQELEATECFISISSQRLVRVLVRFGEKFRIVHSLNDFQIPKWICSLLVISIKDGDISCASELVAEFGVLYKYKIVLNFERSSRPYFDTLQRLSDYFSDSQVGSLFCQEFLQRYSRGDNGMEVATSMLLAGFSDDHLSSPHLAADLYWLEGTADSGLEPVEYAKRLCESASKEELRIALLIWVRHARLHNVQAIYHLGICCWKGVGVEKNPNFAIALLQFSGKYGHTEAKSLLPKVHAEMQESGKRSFNLSDLLSEILA